MTPPTLMDRLEAILSAVTEARGGFTGLDWFDPEADDGKHHAVELDARGCKRRGADIANLVVQVRDRKVDNKKTLSLLEDCHTLARHAELIELQWGDAPAYRPLREAIEAALRHAQKADEVYLVATVPGHLRETFNKAPSAEFYVHAFVAKDLALELERTGEGYMHVVRDERFSKPDVRIQDLLDYPLDENGEWLVSL